MTCPEARAGDRRREPSSDPTLRMGTPRGRRVLLVTVLGSGLLVLQMQVVAGFSPLAAGTALLPVTALMLLLSARAGRLATRIGPRVPITVGLLVAAAGMVLMMRVGPGASYLVDVLPAVVVFGLGLSAMVAPLTATVLDSAEDRRRFLLGADHLSCRADLIGSWCRQSSLFCRQTRL